ncbi:uncharacterized protein LOC115891213 [Sitophilus oryzae]|uniref:Uncharacterized protein LOC115891213 n=1 Tax=Sitophilus oryzae TaxID=7048 RepID=A0A6J2YWC9_SITOR|nr:uncharacterized protein LOC115891213 [Sitophilus oryzae]
MQEKEMMVSYYNSMYHHQQTAPNGHFQTNNRVASWYPPGYHQGAQMNTATGPYMAQEEPQMWHHHGASGHAMFHNEFADFVHTGIPSIQQPIPETENHLPSPPITVSGSDMSSPGGQNGNITPPQQLIQCNIRPPPARSPYEWIKKTSYQTQPTPDEGSHGTATLNLFI